MYVYTYLLYIYAYIYTYVSYICLHISTHLSIGKTSILLRYTKGEYNDRQVSTLQASYLDKRVMINTTTVQLSIWDTAGQERFHALGTTIYYILICYLYTSNSYVCMYVYVTYICINVYMCISNLNMYIYISQLPVHISISYAYIYICICILKSLLTPFHAPIYYTFMCLFYTISYVYI